ncbi:MAG: hypothetical protein WBD72_09935, partial [Candidatus Acidiferrum sp.]
MPRSLDTVCRGLFHVEPLAVGLNRRLSPNQLNSACSSWRNGLFHVELDLPKPTRHRGQRIQYNLQCSPFN